MSEPYLWFIDVKCDHHFLDIDWFEVCLQNQHLFIYHPVTIVTDHHKSMYGSLLVCKKTKKKQYKQSQGFSIFASRPYRITAPRCLVDHSISLLGNF